jgi:hypothetical protein
MEFVCQTLSTRASDIPPNSSIISITCFYSQYNHPSLTRSMPQLRQTLYTSINQRLLWSDQPK